MADPVNDYVVGRGRLFFGQFKPGTRTAKGEKYFGNTPALSLAQDEETLDHYNSDAGVRVKDATVTLQNDSSGSFQCDNISDANLALWFRGVVERRVEAGSASATSTITFSTAVPAEGDKVTIGGEDIVFSADPAPNEVDIAATIGAQATALANYINATPSLGVTATVVGPVVTLTAISPGTGGNGITLAKTAATPGNITVGAATLTGGADVEETITAIERGLWYQLGSTDATPQGVRGIGTVEIADIAEDSYVVETATGRIYFKPEAEDIVDGVTDAVISYGVSAGVEDIVIAKGETIEGALRFIANNAAGTNRDYFWPYVKLTPDGDFALKGDDWQNMTFNFEILLRDETVERQYITKRVASNVA